MTDGCTTVQLGPGHPIGSSKYFIRVKIGSFGIWNLGRVLRILYSLISLAWRHVRRPTCFQFNYVRNKVSKALLVEGPPAVSSVMAEGPSACSSLKVEARRQIVVLVVHPLPAVA